MWMAMGWRRGWRQIWKGAAWGAVVMGVVWVWRVPKTWEERHFGEIYGLASGVKSSAESGRFEDAARLQGELRGLVGGREIASVRLQLRIARANWAMGWGDPEVKRMRHAARVREVMEGARASLATRDKRWLMRSRGELMGLENAVEGVEAGEKREAAAMQEEVERTFQEVIRGGG
jgi:hypothetical protein